MHERPPPSRVRHARRPSPLPPLPAAAGVSFLMDSFSSSVLVLEASHQRAFLTQLDKMVALRV